MEGTRVQQVQEAQKVQENRLNDLARNQDAMGQKMDAMDTRMEGLQVNVLAIMKNLEDLTRAMVGVQKGKGKQGDDHNPDKPYEEGSSSRRREDEIESIHRKKEGFHGNKGQRQEWGSEFTGGIDRHYKKTIRLEFPKFDGQDHRGWLRKCHKFFKYHRVEEEEKVELATMHFEGSAELWYQNFNEELDRLSWEDFIREMAMRFNAQPYENIEGEFSKLVQTTTVAEYQGRFEELRAIIKAEYPGLNERFYINNCISGLKEEIRHQVHMFFPKTLTQTFSIARIQEINVKSQYKTKIGQNPYTRSYINNTNSLSNTNSNTSINSFHKPANPFQSISQSRQSTTIPTKKLTREEMQARRDKGLCYNCDEIYKPGHRCKRLFMIVGITEEEEEQKEEWFEAKESQEGEMEEEEIKISVHALAGHTGMDTIQLEGKTKNSKLVILVDSGSTHNFLDVGMAKRLGCKLISTTDMSVTVADGGKLVSNSICPNFQWETQGYNFNTQMRILPLGGCSAVLGAQWLRSLGPVTFDFTKLEISFEWKGELINLKGRKGGSQATIKMVTGEALQGHFRNNEVVIMAQIFSINGENEEESKDAEVVQLIKEFEDIFEEPKSLPPQRRFDHHIPLLPGSHPVNNRAYRSPYAHNTEIENMVKEMLESGIIQESNSPFASPVILVKKKDGTWRMCVDYRDLNKLTVKDKFPIPLIDDLLAELRGAKVYTKLDLRAGYHQIRLHKEDIPKTAFRTHFGLFEFKVMPFGLTNATATFQGMMNHAFQDHLRKFILVFFDDILVYSKDIKAHLAHLRMTFQLLRQHQLYVKRSKCFFAQDQVEYLGHIVTGSGVQADPAKIKCMMEWPTPKTVKGLRGFLGLTGYYRKFIRGYGIITKPLTRLLQKGAFKWNEEAEDTFRALKGALSSTPVLAMPDFSKEFVIETDACQNGIGAVLQQEGHPIAYHSKALGPRSMGFSTYEKELLAIIQAVEKW